MRPGSWMVLAWAIYEIILYLNFGAAHPTRFIVATSVGTTIALILPLGIKNPLVGLRRFVNCNLIGYRAYFSLHGENKDELHVMILSRRGTNTGPYVFAVDLGGWFPKAYPKRNREAFVYWELKRPRRMARWIRSNGLEISIKDNHEASAKLPLFLALTFSDTLHPLHYWAQSWGSLIHMLAITAVQKDVACEVLLQAIEKIADTMRLKRSEEGEALRHYLTNELRQLDPSRARDAELYTRRVRQGVESTALAPPAG